MNLGREKDEANDTKEGFLDGFVILIGINHFKIVTIIWLHRISELSSALQKSTAVLLCMYIHGEAQTQTPMLSFIIGKLDIHSSILAT